jgi:hypothetical protein
LALIKNKFISGEHPEAMHSHAATSTAAIEALSFIFVTTLIRNNIFKSS